MYKHDFSYLIMEVKGFMALISLIIAKSLSFLVRIVSILLSIAIAANTISKILCFLIL